MSDFKGLIARYELNIEDGEEVKKSVKESLPVIISFLLEHVTYRKIKTEVGCSRTYLFNLKNNLEVSIPNPRIYNELVRFSGHGVDINKLYQRWFFNRQDIMSKLKRITPNIIRYVCEHEGLYQQELAEQIGCSKSMVTYVLKERKMFQLPVLKELNVLYEDVQCSQLGKQVSRS